jgi:hypothetical protein
LNWEAGHLPDSATGLLSYAISWQESDNELWCDRTWA